MVPKPAPMKVLNSPESPFEATPFPVSDTGLVLPVGGLDDVLARSHQLIRLEHDVRAGGLGGLLPGLEVRLVDPQDLHELDAVDRVHDAVQLALVEGAAERPARPGAGRVAAHE